jgi:dihydroxy-acid dehydratase
MTRKLRSNYEIGTSFWAVRRAQWRALGLTDADMAKPKIAVVNTSSELAICFSHLDGVAKAVKEGVRAAGGLPFEIRTAAPSDFIHSAGRAGGYILPSRDLITNDIEVQVEGAQLDGMVCLASCDKTTPGQLMAAARLNIPTIVAICGYQASGVYKGEHVDIEDVFLHAGYHLTGATSLEDLTGMSENAVTSPGVCAGMGTANSMHMACEALGLALPGAAPVAANSEKMFDYARRCGERIVAMVWEDLRPRDILKPAAFANAVRTMCAASASINAVKHLQAIATEARVDVDVYSLFEREGAATPVLCAVRPNGDSLIEDLEAAGGARTLMKSLAPLLDLTAQTAAGKTVGEILENAAPPDGAVIRPLSRPYSDRPAIVIVRGSLAPEGAIVKMGLRWDRELKTSGKARVFHATDQAVAAVREGRIGPGDVVVLAGLGLQGAPGMSMASRVVFALEGAGLGPQIPFVTDGQLSGLVNKGLVVGEVSPEAAIGGPLGLVHDGDVIDIDMIARKVDLRLDPAEWAARRERFQRIAKETPNGWLTIYARSVGPLSEGATLVGRTRTQSPLGRRSLPEIS